MAEPKFAPGFRLSTSDVLILVGGGATTVVLASIDLWIGLASAFTVAHFFLFCNVLRMSRPLELVWTTVFAALAIDATLFGDLPWPAVFAVSAGLTVVLATIEARRPSYHGVGWRILNPHLPEWWSAHTEGADRR